MNTAARIKHLRVEKLGLRQKQLAHRLGVDPMTVSRWERGATVPDDLHRVLLARLADVHPNWILGDGDDGEQAA